MEGLNTIKPVTAYHQVLCCPKCKNILTRVNDTYFCQNCAHSYPILDGIPSFVDQNAAVDSFDASAFRFLFEMEQRHFWHVGRKEIILDVLRRNLPHLAGSRMLEIGCGNGSVLTHLKQNGVNIEGGDIFLEGLRFCRQRAGSGGLYHIDILSLPFRNAFEIVGAFDVLEHIDDDEEALSEINQALKPRGRLILTVPAHKFLWSYFDVQSHHQRRYSKSELVAKLERSGFVIRKISFFMFFLFPLLAVVRLMGNMFHRGKSGKQNVNASLERSFSNLPPSTGGSKREGEKVASPSPNLSLEGRGNAMLLKRRPLELRTVPAVNEVFLGLLRLEKLLIRFLSLPFGASLLVLAEKK